jgi:hypothetical protein
LAFSTIPSFNKQALRKLTKGQIADHQEDVILLGRLTQRCHIVELQEHSSRFRETRRGTGGSQNL